MLPAAPTPNHLDLASMAMCEITITCRDGSRLRLSERRDYAQLKGDIFDTAEYRADNQGEDRRLSRREPEWLAPSLFPGHSGNLKSAKVMTRRFPPPWTVEEMTSLRLSPRPVRPEGGELCQ
jgi:hypothetical protein